jgi:drug/metabolite transporter (DMT)-like permease
MPEWYLLSLAALILLGTQRFLYKVAAERNCSSSLTTAVFMGTVTVMSAAVYIVSEEPAGNFTSLILLSLVNSVAFALATVAHMEALRHLPAGITFPLTRLSLLVVIIFAIFFFNERPNPLQWVGILLGFSVVAVLAGEAGSETRPEGSAGAGLLLIGVCVLCGAVAAISSKLAAVSTSKAGFMALSYLLATFFSLAIDKKWGKRKAGASSGEAVKIGVVMGLLNFFGFYAFLSALATGPLSMISLITGMHFVIAIVLSVLIYRESISRPKVIGLGMTLLAVFFLQL